MGFSELGFQLVGSIESGVAVHDSKKSWERFRDDILMPRMTKGIKGGFTTPPQETDIAVYNLQP